MMNFNAFNQFSYGVYVISTYDNVNSRFTGCIANSAMQITPQPPSIAISINKGNYTHDCISKTGEFAISVLPESCNPRLIGQFGFRSGRDISKFDGVDHFEKDNFAILDAACAWVTCKVEQQMDADSHTVFLGRVIDCDLSEGNPMTYAYYHNVIKGKSPKAAPTYIPD